MPSRSALAANASYAILAGVIVLLELPPVLGFICLAPLVLFAPGYGLVGALRIPVAAELPWRNGVFAVALSMASVVLGGVVLNAAFALTPTAWAVWLISLTLLATAVALIRCVRRQSARGVGWGPRRFGGAKRRVILWSIAGLVAGAALAGAVAINAVNSRRAFDKPLTQLTLLSSPSGGKRWFFLSVKNLSSGRERLLLTISRPRNRSIDRILVLHASQTWTLTESTTTPLVRASLTKAGQARPFTTVMWTGAPK